MKRFAEQLKKRADGLKLTADEKAHLRARLSSFMEYHPLPQGRAIDLPRVVKEQESAVGFWNAWVVGRMAGSFAVLLLVAVPALAENALPGEALYPIKIRFNEEIRGALNSSPYQRIEWETERLERRLAEAQLLAEAGRLTLETEAEVASAIKRHSLTAKSSIEAIRANDSDEAAMAEIALSSTLEVSAEVLNRRGQQDSSASLLSGAVNEARAAVAPRGEGLSYPRLLARVEAETTRAYEYLNTVNAPVSSVEKADINRRLEDIGGKARAAADIKDEDEAAAVRLLAEALSSTQKLISFMTNLEVRRSVTVDELVPAVPTAPERGRALSARLDEAAELITMIEAEHSKLPAASNDYVAVADALAQYRVLEGEAAAALAADDMDAAETTVSQAVELARVLRETMLGLGFALGADSGLPGAGEGSR